MSNTPNVGIHNNSITDNTIYGVWSDRRTDATNNWWGDANGPKDNSLVPDVCGLSLDNPTGIGNAASTCVLYNPWLTQNPFAGGGPTVPLTGGVVAGGDGRGQAGTSTANSIIPVIGGQQTIVSCNSQSVTLQIEDIKVTLTGLCDYRVILDTVSKENLPGDLGQGNNLEEGVTIKLLKSGKMIDTLPVDASLEVVYPKPASGSTTILTWNGNAWVEQISFVEGNNITTKITSPTTLILVTH